MNGETGKQAVVIVGNCPNGTGAARRTIATSFFRLSGLNNGWRKIRAATNSWAGKLFALNSNCKIIEISFAFKYKLIKTFYRSVSPAAFHSPIRTRSDVGTALKRFFMFSIHTIVSFDSISSFQIQFLLATKKILRH